MLNCLIAEVRFDDRKIVRHENRNMRYPNMSISNMK